MNVLLTSKTARKTFYFDSNSVTWKSQNYGSEFVLCYHTKLQAPFNELFVKRWIGGSATGHSLLLSYIQTSTIEYTPALLGCSKEVIRGKTYYYYFFERLNNVIELHNFVVNKKLPHNNIFTIEFIEKLIKTLLYTFHQINKRDFYYTDLNYKNIMVNFKNKNIYLIDVDSSEHKTTKLKTDDSISYTWWTLYLDKIAKNEIKVSYSHLNKTMLMSFALMWCKAFREMESYNRTNVSDILEGKPALNLQRKLISLFDNKQYKKIKQTYHLDKGDNDAITKICELWENIFNEMKQQEHIEWNLVSKFIGELSNLTLRKDPVSLHRKIKQLTRYNRW